METKILEINCEVAYACGDIHGEYSAISNSIKKNELKNCAIICCGDIGIGFEKPNYYVGEFNKLDKVCKQYNVHLVMFNGNHDNPIYFEHPELIDGYKGKYIHLIDSYTVVKLKDKNILCVGGAISIDRSSRLNENHIRELKYARYHLNREDDDKYMLNNPMVYWENETPIFCSESLKKICDEGITIDYICTHSAPSFCTPTTKLGISGWLCIDEKLEGDLNKEREVFDDIYEYLTTECNISIKKWFYGHFHFDNSDFFEDKECSFHLLDMVRNNKLSLKEII